MKRQRALDRIVKRLVADPKVLRMFLVLAARSFKAADERRA